jgi:hypothetical protein
MEKSKANNPYLVLLIILSYYLASQIFQQYVLRVTIISNPVDEEQANLFITHWLNITRLGTILFSMFLMVIAWVIIYYHFNNISAFWSLSALIFLLLFCFFEIAYRSLELFMVVLEWSPGLRAAQGIVKEKLQNQSAIFDSFVSAIYFPLLFSQLLGSLILIYLSIRSGAKLFLIAMTINAFRLALRLSDYVGFPELNIFSGAWYFPPVAVIFGLLIWWSYKQLNEFDRPSHQC